MDNTFIMDILKNSLMINIEQGMNIYHLLNQVLLLNVPGEVVELGCYVGRTAAVMQKTLDQHGSTKQIHVYDSFEGLPEKQEQDGDARLGKGRCATTKDELVNIFQSFNLKLPEIHEGWFKDTLPKQLPKQICFAHFDGDLYSSTKESLKFVYPKLAKGAIVLIDDYCDPVIVDKMNNGINQNGYSQRSGRRIRIFDALPGVKKACDEFLADKPEKIHVLIAGEERHAFFRKQ